MEVNIRKIYPDDYTSVLSLWNCELQNNWVTSDNITSTYERMAEDDNYQTFVAVMEDKVVGFITIVQVLAAGFPVGYIKINGLAVKKDFQNNGVGKQLIQHIEQFAYEKGISNIGLASGFQRTEAHSFYEHLGYDKGSYYFSKMLEHTK